MIAISNGQTQLSRFIRVSRSNGAEQQSWGVSRTADAYVNGLRTRRLACGEQDIPSAREGEWSEQSYHNPSRYTYGIHS